MAKKTLSLKSSIIELPGIGPAITEKLNKRHIYKVIDFLFFLPYKYQDRTKITEIKDLKYGLFSQILVTINSTKIQYARQRNLIINCSDSSGHITIRLFNFSKAQINLFRSNTKALIYGQAVEGQGRWAMMHPDIKIIKASEKVQLSDKLSPVYSGKLGVGSLRIIKWIDIAINCLEKEYIQDFPPDFLEKHNMSSLKSSLKDIHHPKIGQKEKDILNADNPSLKRIVLDELLAKKIVMTRKKENNKKNKAFAINIDNNLQTKLLDSLPFLLTNAQHRVISEIFNDININIPMHRLVQGDVGSGKTIVAFSAILQFAYNGIQSVIMAPTEILSKQHYNLALKLIGSLGFSIVCLSGKTSIKNRKEVLKKISSGDAKIIIGTHALFQEDVIYHKLGLAIIDEQHRFGVHQRLMLKEKAKKTEKTPHVLIMTATPIPRTLAMSHYADLDTSIIDEIPENRKSIVTVLLSDNRRNELIDRINTLVATGQQVYWVCPLIEESELLHAQAVEDIYIHLKELMPKLNIAYIHGKQKNTEKTNIINNFLNNKINLLVSTTVIEVGVNVPNATLMIIENPERFGLAQLHQLRGRVGRGAEKSYCVLLFKSPLSETAKQRLKVIRNTQDGFEIAQKDLEIRGAGEILGTKQTGEINFKIANLERDAKYLEMANLLANDLIQNNIKFADEIVSRWFGNASSYIDI